MNASAPLDAAQQAVEHTRRHLFPFRFERWLALGFVAFLDQCGRSGGGPGVNAPAGGWGDTGRAGQEVDQGLAWLATHVLLVSVLTAVVLAFVVVFIAAVLWINSRGVFMYIDNVASGRADVARPWREHARQASSYFVWSFGLSMATLSAVLVLVAAIAATILVMVRGRPPSMVFGVIVVVVLVLVLLGLLMAAVLASVALRDFVAPLQLATGRSCGEAVRLFGRLLRAHPAGFAVYVLLKVVLMFGVGVAAVIVGCATCCCGFLPVVAQTLLQPACYFERAWPLFVLRALGQDVISSAAPPLAGGPPIPTPIADTNNTLR